MLAGRQWADHDGTLPVSIVQVLEVDPSARVETAALYAEAHARMAIYPKDHPGRRLLDLHASAADLE